MFIEAININNVERELELLNNNYLNILGFEFTKYFIFCSQLLYNGLSN